jgi:hypothetical protein
METGLRGLAEYGNDFFDVLIGSDHNLIFLPAISF